MDYFLIIMLGIVVFVLWNTTRDTTARLRDELTRLQREIDFLQSQLAALVKANAAREVVTAGQTPPPSQPAAAAKPFSQPEPSRPAEAAHAPAASIAAFRPPAESAPQPTAHPAPTPAPPHPQPTPGSKPYLEQRFDAGFETDPALKPATSAPAPNPPPPQPVAAFTHDQDSTSAEPVPTGRLFSLEETLGANWLGKIGIGILVIGIASFLALKLQTWGPAGKVLCGFAVSAALLGGGVWLERQATYRIFARGGIGGGWALAFFTTFAMYHLPAARVIDSLPTDLVWMLIVASGMVAHSLRYRSQTITALAFMLGFATLLTSHLGEPNETVVFSLTASAILAVALVVITTIRHWAVLELCGLIAVYLSHLVWLTKVLPANHSEFAEFWPSTALILLYWLIFRLAYILRTPLDRNEENISSVSAVVNSGGALGLLKFQSAHPEWAFWALITLGLLEMALAYWAKPKRRQAFVVLSTIASVLLVASVPFRFHGVSWPVLWLVQAQVLAICGLRLGEPVFRRLGLLTGLVTGGVLALHDVMPLAVTRLLAPDPSRHWSLTAALALAAILYWTHAEVYTRRWPEMAANAIESFALKISSWLALGAAATALWVVLPDQWLPVGLLALFLVLVAAGHLFQTVMPPLEGDILALFAAGVLVFHHILPLVFLRFESEDPSHHPVTTAVLGLAAFAFWIRGEVFPRMLPKLPASADWDPSAWEAVILPIASCIGTAAAAAALWIALPAPWVAVGWLALIVLLGVAADWQNVLSFALQADALAIAALAGLAGWDLWREDWNHRTPILIAAALLYCGMRRRTVPTGSRNYVPASYSWAATVLLPLLAYDIFKEPWIAPVLVALFLALFEIGRFAARGFLRWQGYLLAAIAFFEYFAELPAEAVPGTHFGAFSLTKSLLLEVLTLAAAGYWLLERTRDPEHCPRRDHIVGLFADALGTLSIALWFAYRFPSHWIPVPGDEAWVTSIWAAMAIVLLALAWLIRRHTFLAQSVALAVAVVLRGLFVDLPAEGQATFWHGPLFHLGVAALILLAGLPFAFRLRGPDFWTGASIQLSEPLALVLRRPEQWFFFAPFGLMVTALATKLSSGHITIAWSLLGLAAFLLALAVGERSFRLAGLALLLVSVAKILLMDVWALPPAERYIPLIVLGLALFAVSFLYTRFSATIRKFL